MPEWGLDSTGFRKPRAADFLTEIRDTFLAGLAARGLSTDIDWERDTFLGPLSEVVSARLGDVGDALQALYDAFHPNNASGIQLDNLAQLVGVVRSPATHSVVTLTLSGVAGTAIPAGSRVQGGGADGTARWVLSSDVMIGGGTASTTAEAEEAGEVIALAGEVNSIVTPVTGWTGVTNASAAVPGQAVESDAALRLRRAQSLQIQGSSSLQAIRANLRALDYLEAVVVIDNDRPTMQVVQGVLLQPHSVGVIVYPDPTTDARRAEVAGIIWRHLTAGIATSGSDVVATVTAADGAEKVVRYDIATTLSVTVVITVVLASGYVLADVDTAIEESIAAYFADEVGVGQALYDLSLIVLAAGVEGVRRATATLNGSTSITPSINQRPVLSGTPTVTT